jgi:GNAT superfamily N-acetyltransferase
LLVVTVRQATPDDLVIAEAIICVALAAYQLPFEPDGRDADVKLFGRRVEHDDLVAEIDGSPVGVASVGPHGDAGVAWVSKVFVHVSARRKGVGRALLHRVHDAARARGYQRIGLRTRVIFKEAIALYESEGYSAAPTSPTIPLETGDVVYFRQL